MCVREYNVHVHTHTGPVLTWGELKVTWNDLYKVLEHDLPESVCIVYFNLIKVTKYAYLRTGDYLLCEVHTTECSGQQGTK